MLSIHYLSIMMRIFLYRLATALGMWPNSEYWWSTKQPQVTDLRWQLGFQWHGRGIELVFKSLDCFTKRLFHTATIFAATYEFVVWNFTRLITRLKRVFFTSIWWGSTQLQCICYLRCTLISRPPRVFRRFKRRSCYILDRSSVVLTPPILTRKHCHWAYV